MSSETEQLDFSGNENWPVLKVTIIGVTSLVVALIVILIAAQVVTSSASSFGPPAHSEGGH